MAKGKNAAALFEVIQSSRFPNRPDPLRTPRWWFKRRDSLNEGNGRGNGPLVSREIPQPIPDAIAKTASPTLSTTTSTLVTPVVPEAPAGVSNGFSTGFSKAVSNGVAAAATAVRQSAAAMATTRQRWAIPRLPLRGVNLQLDPDSHQVTVKVSYYGAVVSAFTVLVVIGLAYAVGVKMHRGPVAATASPSTELLRSRPPHPEVLDVAANSPTHFTSASGSHNVDGAVVASNKQPGKAGAGEASPPSPPTVDAQRVIGRQYVVIQIYPEQKSAEEAAALLNKNNIPCTIEKGLAGWATSVWYCVVGTTGFDRVRSNSDFDRYESSINRLSEQFAGSSKFKKFEPRAYRWKGAAS